MSVATAYRLWKRQSGSNGGIDNGEDGGDNFYDDGDYGDGSYDWWWSPVTIHTTHVLGMHADRDTGWHGNPLRHRCPPLRLHIPLLRRRLLARASPSEQRPAAAAISSMDGATTNATADAECIHVRLPAATSVPDERLPSSSASIQPG
jgi:hypothetical protein